MSSVRNEDKFASIFKLKFYKNKTNWKISSDKQDLLAPKNGSNTKEMLPKEATPLDDNECPAKHTPSRRLEMLLQGGKELNVPEYVDSLAIEDKHSTVDRRQMPLTKSPQCESETATSTEESKLSPTSLLESTSPMPKSNCHNKKPGSDIGQNPYHEQLPVQNDLSQTLGYAYESSYNASKYCAQQQQMYQYSTQNYSVHREDIQQTENQAMGAGYVVRMTTRVVEQQWEWNDTSKQQQVEFTDSSSYVTPAYSPHNSSGSYYQNNIYSLSRGKYQEVPKWEPETDNEEDYGGVIIEELSDEESAGLPSESTAWSAPFQQQHSICQEYNISEMSGGARELPSQINEWSASNRSQKPTYGLPIASMKVSQNSMEYVQYPANSNNDSPKPARPDRNFHYTYSQNARNQTFGHNNKNKVPQQNTTNNAYKESTYHINPKTALQPITKQQSDSSYNLFSQENSSKEKIPEQYANSSNQLASLLGSLSIQQASANNKMNKEMPSPQTGAIRKDYNALQNKSVRQGTAGGLKIGSSNPNLQRSNKKRQNNYPELGHWYSVPWDSGPNDSFYNNALISNASPSVPVAKTLQKRIQSKNKI